MDIETAALSKRVSGKACHAQSLAAAVTSPAHVSCNVTTILPRCLSASMRSNALSISANGDRQTSGITAPRNFHIDRVDPRGRFALPEFFVGRRCAQAEQCPPFGPAEHAGEGATAGDFNSL